MREVVKSYIITNYLNSLVQSSSSFLLKACLAGVGAGDDLCLLGAAGKKCFFTQLRSKYLLGVAAAVVLVGAVVLGGGAPGVGVAAGAVALVGGASGTGIATVAVAEGTDVVLTGISLPVMGRMTAGSLSDPV